MVPYTLTNGVLSFTLNTLFNVCKPNVTIAANLMKNPFFDVFENDWFYNNVMDVHQKSLMLSTSLHNFGSKLNPVRAMAVTVLYRLSNDTVSFENIFSDVASGVWYEGAVAWASANGITKGTRDGKFSPNVNITRE